jgi:hypothetical protein
LVSNLAIIDYGDNVSIYTPKIRQAVRSVLVPQDFVMDIVEYDFIPPYIALRFYESHWRSMTDNEKLKCIRYLQKIKNIIESYGIKVTLDPVYDIPGGQTIA